MILQKAKGSNVYRFNSNDGSVKEISHVKTSNPSFLAVPGTRNMFIPSMRPATVPVRAVE
jgi:hypothetical protein